MIFWLKFLVFLLVYPGLVFCAEFPSGRYASIVAAPISQPSIDLQDSILAQESKRSIEQQICRAHDQQELNNLLFMVIEHEHLRITDKDAFVLDLLFRGANPNAVSFNRNSALMRAASFDLTRIVSMLLAHGARIDHKNKWGETVFKKAKGDLMRRLLEKPSRSKHEGFSFLSIKTLLGMLPSR